MSPYVIKELSLENFLSHAKTTLKLPRGSIAIVGENGAGKSSLFEAIYYALTTNGWRGKTANLVRIGSSKATVTLKLGDEEDEVLSRATIERRRDSSTSTYKLVARGKVIATTASDYRQEMAKILGLHGIPDYRGFIESAVIIRQGGLEDIASVLAKEDSKRLRELVESAIGIPQIRAAADNIRSHVIRAVRSDGTPILSVEVGPRRRAEVVQAIERAKKLKQDSIAQERALEEEIKQLMSQKAAYERAVKEAEEDVNNTCGQLSAADALEAQLSELQRQITAKRGLLEELSRRESELAQRARELEVRSNLASLEPKVRELDRVELSLGDAYRRLAQLKGLVDLINDVKKHKDEFEKYEQLSKELESLRQREAELSARLRELSSLKKQYDSLMASANAIIKDAADNFNVRLTLDDATEKLEGLTLQLEEELEGLRRSVEELSGKLEVIKSSRARLNDIIKVLGESGGEAKCPVCGSPLSSDKREELMSHYEAELKELDDEESKTLRALDEARRNASSKESELAKARSLTVQLKQVLSSITAEMRTAESLAGRVRDELQQVRGEEEALEANIKGLEAGHSAYVSAMAKLSKAGATSEDKMASILDEYLAVQRSIDELNARRASLLKDLLDATGAKSYEEAKEAILSSQRSASELQAVKAQLEALNEQMASLKAELESLTATRESIKSKYDQILQLKPKCEELKRRAESVREEYNKLLMKIAADEANLEQARKNLQQASEDLDALLKALDKFDAALGVLEALERLEKALYRRALLSIENEMNEVFRIFGLGYSSVDVKETQDAFYFVVVDKDGHERPIASLSGGEQIVIALAYVIALNKIMHSNIGFLLLDEPTDMLDDERRRALVDVIGRLTQEGGIPQLIIITHHKDIMDSVDKVYMVEKGPNGVSSVRDEGDRGEPAS